MRTGWGGHWRGSNNTQETVICELSFMTRQPLENLCSRGYTVAGSPLAWTWAGDLMVRHHTRVIQFHLILTFFPL